MLHWFLRDVGINLELDWGKMYAYDFPKVIAAYELVPEDQKRQAEEVVREIVLLANQEGVAALREAARLDNRPYWAVLFKHNPSAYMQAIWAWATHRALFEKAKKLLQVNRMPHVRKRTGLPVGPPPFLDEKLEEFKVKLQTFFMERQNRGGVCSIDAFDRGDGRYFVLAYPDDVERPFLRHDERNTLVGDTLKQVFEIAFEVNANEGSLAVSAKSDVREDLENLFIRTMYGTEPPPVITPKYNLQMLKDPQLVLATEARDFVTAEVCFLSIKWPGISSASTFTAHQRGSFVRPIAYLLGQEPKDLKDGTVASAKIRFHFLPKPGRRAGALCVEFTSESNMVIRCKDLLRVEVMEHYLKTWGIS